MDAMLDRLDCLKQWWVATIMLYLTECGVCNDFCAKFIGALEFGRNEARRRSQLLWHDFSEGLSDAYISTGCSRRPRYLRKVEVSKTEEVRDFYERMPYPLPLTSLDEHRELYKNPDRRRAMSHLI